MSARFPNVPRLPGVPQLARLANQANAAATTVILGQQAISRLLWQSSKQTIRWGIYNEFGQLVVQPDSVLNFDHRPEWEIMDFPVQRGAFATYNKVKMPFEISVRLYKSGTEFERATFLSNLDRAAGTLNLYTVITPERTYRNVNILRYEVSRRGTSSAYALAEVEVFFREVQTVEAQYQSTQLQTADAQNPSAQGNTAQGPVQPQTADATTQAKAKAAL